MADPELLAMAFEESFHSVDFPVSQGRHRVKASLAGARRT
jgi:hypothetical protein